MKKILPFAITWMNVEGITLSEISQKEKDKSIYMWTVFLKKNSCTNRHRVERWLSGVRDEVENRVNVGQRVKILIIR